MESIELEVWAKPILLEFAIRDIVRQAIELNYNVKDVVVYATKQKLQRATFTLDHTDHHKIYEIIKSIDENGNVNDYTFEVV